MAGSQAVSAICAGRGAEKARKGEWTAESLGHLVTCNSSHPVTPTVSLSPLSWLPGSIMWLDLSFPVRVTGCSSIHGGSVRALGVPTTRIHPFSIDLF